MPSEELAAYLQQSRADVLVAEAGAIDLGVLSRARTTLKDIICVTRGGNQHLDWKFDGRLKVAVWHDLVKETEVNSDLPPSDAASPPPSVTTLWSSPTGPGSFVEYTTAVSPHIHTAFYIVSHQ